MRVAPGREHASVPVDRSAPSVLAALADPARLAALRRTELLGGPPSETLQRIAGMTAAQLGVPAVLATVVDADRELLAASAWLEESWFARAEWPLSHSLGQYVVASAAPLVVPDSRTVPWLRDNGALADLGIVAYAGIPLLADDGRAVGALAAIDREPREWSEADLAQLDDSAALAQSELGRLSARRDAREVSALLLRLQGLTDATSTARELDGLLDDITAACADTFAADVAVIDLLDGQGGLVRRLARGLTTDQRTALRLGEGFAGRIGTVPQTVAVPDLATAAAEPGVAPLAAAGVRSLLAAPLIVDHRLRGTIWVGASAPGVFSELDRQLLAVSAERFAAVIVRAQRYERDRHVADTLVAALQPARLPEVPGVRFAGRYQPAERGLGGDWYDVFQLPGGAMGAAIGDVVGHGIEAAVEAVRLRNALRGAVLAGNNPSETVMALNAHAATQPGAMASTMVYLELDGPARRLRWASAGHVPVVIAEDGRSEWLGAGGPPLGVVDLDPWPSGERELAPGSRVVLFTDGLIERRTEPLDIGIDRIAAIAAEAPDLETLCENALGQAPTPRFDDLALIALELG
jgi:GAF domain-containing protein